MVMGISAEIMRLILAAGLLGMALLAALYLRKRALTFAQYLAWGVLLILVPLFGPFLVIYLRPGRLTR
jgi:hypothetical protein